MLDCRMVIAVSNLGPKGPCKPKNVCMYVFLIYRWSDDNVSYRYLEPSGFVCPS